jgi:putative peptide zinc metalloprotease protein
MLEYPKLEDKIEITPFETSSISQVYLLKTPDGRTFQISSKLYQLLLLLDGEKSLEEIASEFSSQNSKEHSPDDISQIIEKFLIPEGLLSPNQGSQKTQFEIKQKSSTSLSLRISLFSPKALHPLTDVLSKLFYPPVFITLTTIAFVILVVILPSFQVFDFTKTIQTGYTWIIIYALVTVTVIFHELGHASGCRYYGCLHGYIGFGLYLMFPVFYVDINDAWRLSRKQRVMIDIGGVYFQFLSTIILVSGYIITKSPIFLMTMFLTYLMIFTNLNPLFKYDGYWLLSDLVGIPNLRKRATELLKQLFKKEIRTTYQLSQIPPWAKTILFSYTVLSNVFFLYFGYRLTKFLAGLLKVYPTILTNSVFQIRQSIQLHDFNSFSNNVSQIVFPVLVLFSVILMGRKLLYPAFKYVKSTFRHGSFYKKQV